MSKIALIEKEEKVDLTGFDKIISFCMEKDVSVDRYITQEDLDEIYESIYFGFCTWLNQYKDDGAFFYRGIDVLQIYGKGIFDFLFTLIPKIHIVNNIIKKEGPEGLWVSKDTIFHDPRFPSLGAFISDFTPDDVAVHYFVSEKKDESHKIKLSSDSSASPRGYFSLIRKLVNLRAKSKGSKILVLSDLAKIPMLFDYLKEENVVLLREKSPIRILGQLFKNKVAIKLFSDFKLSSGEGQKIRDVANDFMDKLEKPLRSLRINGRDFAPYVRGFLAESWSENLVKVLEMVSRVHRVFDQVQIKSVLLDEDRGIYNNLLSQIAKKHHSRTYVNIHGDLFHRIGFLPLTSDYILAWGQQQKETLTGWGLKSDRVIVSGCSKYDKYLRLSTDFTTSKIRGDLRLPGTAPIVLFGPRSLIKGRNILESVEWKEIIRTMTALSKLQNIELIIKLHPGDPNAEHIKVLVDELQLRKSKIVQDYDPLMLAKAADVLVAQRSTYAIDGLAIAKPVILVDGYSVEKYKGLDVFYDGTSEEKIIDSVNGILNGAYRKHIENWRSAVDYCLDGGEGDASGKIARILA